jgi:hypothetical protein
MFLSSQTVLHSFCFEHVDVFGMADFFVLDQGFGYTGMK